MKIKATVSTGAHRALTGYTVVQMGTGHEHGEGDEGGDGSLGVGKLKPGEDGS